MSELIKPCRECKKVPDKGYPPSRVLNSDWLCSKCSNVKRRKWLAKASVLRKELSDYVKIKGRKDKVIAKLPLVRYLEEVPICPLCQENMITTRKKSETGKPLKWECSACNEIIIGYGL